jgi:hypothetical protein
MNSQLVAVTTLEATLSRATAQAAQRVGPEPLRVVEAVSSREE